MSRCGLVWRVVVLRADVFGEEADGLAVPGFLAVDAHGGCVGELDAEGAAFGAEGAGQVLAARLRRLLSVLQVRQ